MTEKQRSPAFWMACGCLGCLGLLLAAFGVVSLLGFTAARSIGSGFGDPATRAARVEELLGPRLPEGYHPLGAVGVPFFIDAAALVDRPQPPGEPDIENGGSIFVYFQTARWLANTFDEDEEVLTVSEFDIEEEELIGEGQLQLANFRFDYRSMRGELRIENEPFDGVMAVMELECFAGTDRFRFALWMTPPPEALAETGVPETERPEALPTDAPSAEALSASDAEPTTAPAATSTDYTGTPADEAALRTFMEHFDPCR